MLLEKQLKECFRNNFFIPRLPANMRGFFMVYYRHANLYEVHPERGVLFRGNLAHREGARDAVDWLGGYQGCVHEAG